MTEKKMIVDVPDGTSLADAADRPGWQRGITHDSDGIGSHAHIRDLRPGEDGPDGRSPGVEAVVAIVLVGGGAAALWGYQRLQDWRARRRMRPVAPLEAVPPLAEDDQSEDVA